MKTTIFACTLLLVKAINLEVFNSINPMTIFLFIAVLMSLDTIGFLVMMDRK